MPASRTKTGIPAFLKQAFKVKDLPGFGIHGGYKENIIHILICKSIFKKVGQYGLVYFHSKVLVIGVTF